MKQFIKTYWPLWIVLIGAHFPMFLSDRSNWDGALVSYLVSEGRIDIVHEWMASSGLPLFGYIHHAVASTGLFFPLAERLTSFLCLGLAGMATYRILTEHTPLKRVEALIICQIMIAWPFFHIVEIETMSPQMVMMACFYGGWLCYLNAGNIFQRLVASVLIFISFHHGLYLLVHLALFMVLCACQPSWKVFLRKHGWIISLPFIFYIGKTLLFPISHEFATQEYNVPLVLQKDMGIWQSIMRIAWLFLDGLRRSSAHPFYMVGIMAKKWWPLVTVVLIGIGYMYRRALLPKLDVMPKTEKRWLLLSGLLLFSAVIFAHAAVGDYTNIFKPLARHSSHAGIGFGFIALALLAYLPQRWHKIGEGIAVILVVSFTLATAYGHTLWLARKAKDEAIVRALETQPSRKDVTIYFIQDVDVYTGLSWKNDFVERAIMIQSALNRKDVIGFPASVLLEQHVATTMHEDRHILDFYGFTEAKMDMDDPNKVCAGFVDINTDSHASDTKVAWQYVYYGFKGKDALYKWLDSLINVSQKYINLRADSAPC